MVSVARVHRRLLGLSATGHTPTVQHGGRTAIAQRFFSPPTDIAPAAALTAAGEDETARDGRTQAAVG